MVPRLVASHIRIARSALRLGVEQVLYREPRAHSTLTSKRVARTTGSTYKKAMSASRRRADAGDRVACRFPPARSPSHNPPPRLSPLRPRAGRSASASSGLPAALDPAGGARGRGPARRPPDRRHARRLPRRLDRRGAGPRRRAGRCRGTGSCGRSPCVRAARFHDGTPLTAKEVAASFERRLRTEGGRRGRGRLDRAAARRSRGRQGSPARPMPARCRSC